MSRIVAPVPLLPPRPHPSGARPPELPEEVLPRHIALVMDGNGRWAKRRGLPRTEGHRQGEKVLVDLAEGCIELGVKHLSVFAFSTENWRRSPEEVRFIMGYSRKALRKRRDELGCRGVRLRWIGRRRRLWPSVAKELDLAEEYTRDNSTLTLTMCVNYGGRAELADAAARIAHDAAAGILKPHKVDERTVAKYLYDPQLPDVDLFVRTSGEQRISNFLLWQSAYAEMVFTDTFFPDFDRMQLWQAAVEFARRDRRYGGAKG